MLDEGHRRAGARGRRRGRVRRDARRGRRPPRCSTGLEVIPREHAASTGAASFEEMDLDAVLARNPQIALVDELAHTNVPGSRNEKRWQDVEELLDAGIDVISTVNIQHLESLNDVVEQITGVPQRETVPDAVVRAADQVELVDMTAEALRRRMAHGNIYPPEKIDAALDQLLPGRQPDRAARAGAALAGRQGRRGAAAVPRRARHRRHLGGAGAGRGRAHRRPRGRHADPPGRPDRGPGVGRRPARRARRPVRRADRRQPGRRWPRSGSWSSRSAAATTRSSATTSPRRCSTFAQAENATQLVLGASRAVLAARPADRARHRGETIRGSGDIDVHIVTHAHDRRRWRRPARGTGGGITPAAADRRVRARRRAAAAAAPLVLGQPTGPAST